MIIFNKSKTLKGIINQSQYTLQITVNKVNLAGLVFLLATRETLPAWV